MSAARGKVKVERRGSWGEVAVFLQPDGGSATSSTSSNEDCQDPLVLSGSCPSPVGATDSPAKDPSNLEREESTVTEYADAPPTAMRDREYQDLEMGRITFLESQALACVLEDALTQVVILANCNHEIRAMKLDVLSVERKRFDISSIHNMNIGEESSTDKVCNRLSKWDEDRQMVALILARMFVDMAYNRSFHEMDDQLRKWRLEDERDQILVEEETILKTKLANLEAILRREVAANAAELKERDNEYQLIVDAVDDNELINETTLRYVARWETARNGQLSLEQQTEAQRLNHGVQNFKRKTDQEMKISADIENYIQLGTDKYQEQIEEWMRKYDEETEAMDLTIRTTRDETFNLEKECEKLQGKLDTWTAEMEAWTNFTEERRRDQTYLNKMNTCATMVQSWWRGMLVRRQLGPFAPKKVKKGKKGKTGKGKGKKR